MSMGEDNKDGHGMGNSKVGTKKIEKE